MTDAPPAKAGFALEQAVAPKRETLPQKGE